MTKKIEQVQSFNSIFFSFTLAFKLNTRDSILAMKSTVHNEHRDQIRNYKNDLINLEIKADNQIWRKKPRQGITIQCTERK